MTAYTTATDVVLSAMPPISAACRCQPRASLQNPKAARNGSAKEAKPMDRLAFQCPRRDTGSISAPARKVSTREPALARKVITSVELTCSRRPGMFPASAPTTISTRAAGTAILDTDDGGEQGHAQPDRRYVIDVHGRSYQARPGSSQRATGPGGFTPVEAISHGGGSGSEARRSFIRR